MNIYNILFFLLESSFYSTGDRSVDLVTFLILYKFYSYCVIPPLCILYLPSNEYFFSNPQVHRLWIKVIQHYWLKTISYGYFQHWFFRNVFHIPLTEIYTALLSSGFVWQTYGPCLYTWTQNHLYYHYIMNSVMSPD